MTKEKSPLDGVKMENKVFTVNKIKPYNSDIDEGNNNINNEPDVKPDMKKHKEKSDTTNHNNVNHGSEDHKKNISLTWDGLIVVSIGISAMIGLIAILFIVGTKNDIMKFNMGMMNQVNSIKNESIINENVANQKINNLNKVISDLKNEQKTQKLIEAERLMNDSDVRSYIQNRLSEQETGN